MSLTLAPVDTRLADMNDTEERAYAAGQKSLASRLLAELLREFGDAEPTAAEVARLQSERQEAIAALRDLCGEHGDNDWSDSLYLSDIISKHVHCTLDAALQVAAEAAHEASLARARLAAASTPPRSWFYVTEKLPDEDQAVLFWVRWSRRIFCNLGAFRTDENTPRFVSSGDGPCRPGSGEGDAFAWQPAPEPPPLPEDACDPDPLFYNHDSGEIER